MSEATPIDYTATSFDEVRDRLTQYMKTMMPEKWQDFSQSRLAAILGGSDLSERLVTLDDYERWAREPFRDKDLMFDLALDPRAFTEAWRAEMAARVPAGHVFNLEFLDGSFCVTVHPPGESKIRVWAGPEDADCHTEEFDHEDRRK